jgi:hypothetical protein
MKLLNDIFKKSLIVYKNNLWVSKSKYKTYTEKLKLETQEFGYELLTYMKNDENNIIRFSIYFCLIFPCFEYIRRVFLNRNRDLVRSGRDIVLQIKEYEINPPKDKVDSENFNKMHYSKEYTLKY